MATKELRGIIPAVITPIKPDGTMDIAAMEAQVEYLASGGVHGFFVNGTTSEGPILSRKEKREAVRIVRQVSAGRQAICAACIAPSASLVIEEIREIEDLEPDYIVSVAPFYFAASQDGIIDHYRQVAAATKIPLIFYDIPQHTHNPIAIATRFRMIDLGYGVGFKDSSGDFATFSRCVFGSPRKDFAWIQGDDLLDACSMLIGARGIVTGLSNITPVPYVELFAALAKNDTRACIEAQRKITALWNVIPAANGRVIAAIKAAVARRTGGSRVLRQQQQTATDAEAAAVARVLDGIPGLGLR
jgi:dihydrodipicolinate synthase/N-acetylneuraminate lyase